MNSKQRKLKHAKRKHHNKFTAIPVSAVVSKYGIPLPYLIDRDIDMAGQKVELIDLGTDSALLVYHKNFNGHRGHLFDKCPKKYQDHLLWLARHRLEKITYKKRK